MTREEFDGVISKVEAEVDMGEMDSEIALSIWEHWKDRDVDEFMKESQFFIDNQEEVTRAMHGRLKMAINSNRN